VFALLDPKARCSGEFATISGTLQQCFGVSSANPFLAAHMKPMAYLSILFWMITAACQEEDVASVVVEDEVADHATGSLDGINVIFDTDIAEDVDDVGAVAVLHALADRGEVNVIGMMVSMPVDFGAPALDAINTYYGRPDIPIGTLRKSRDARHAGNLVVYNKYLAQQFPNDLRHASNAVESVKLYRELLSKHQDRSVVIVSVGPLTNLYHLLKSPPDEVSPLSGAALVKKKVSRFVMAGGRLPGGSSYNFRVSPEKAEYVINHWPTEHWFVPNEIGDHVLTGSKLIAEGAADSPVKKAYQIYRETYPGYDFRPSWDQMAVLIAARETASGLFKTNTRGNVHAKGHYIQWKNSPDKEHVWFQSNSSAQELRSIIEDLMLQPPRNRS